MERILTRNSVKNKKILVLGLAVTGMSVVRQLLKLGALVTVNDWTSLVDNKNAQTLVEENVRVIAGSHPIELLDEEFEFMVKNPGIPYTNPMVERALELNLPVFTDIELAGAFSEAPIIAITGSNGKTTTTSLTHSILVEDINFSGQSYVGGNIGVPALDVAVKATEADRIILELSSFQLMGTAQLKPHIAAITNLYAAHLDYHGDLQSYFDAKWQITKNQTAEDFLILNFDQEIIRERANETKATVVPFSTKEKLENGAWFNQENEMFMWHDTAVMHHKELALPGLHNIENMLVAIAIAKLSNVGNESIIVATNKFHGVAHRLQFIKEIEGRKFFNDSKATNNDAALTALNSFSAPTIWLAGGLDRNNPVDELLPAMKSVKAMVTFGETAEKFSELGLNANINNIEAVNNIEEAVITAFKMSQPGDIILLSPASASWDQYPNYEVRGECFIAAVHELK